MRATICSLLLLFAATAMPQPAGAQISQVLPEIPESLRILSVLEVKNYWVNMLAEPKEPSRLDRNYHSLIVSYHRQVGERHRLIQAIRAGQYDRLAKIIMLRHNIQAYLLKGDDAKVAALSADLAELEAIAAREEAERANAERLERLIAATERLAAAIENNGGVIPDNANEIVPFESDYDDYDSYLSYLYNEIAICRQPIIIHHPHKHPKKTHGRDKPGHVHPPNSYPVGDPRRTAARSNQQTTTRRTITPSVVVPSPRGTSPLPGRTTPRVQPTRSQPQVRPSSSPMPSQPQVRPVPAPRQPQVRPAR